MHLRNGRNPAVYRLTVFVRYGLLASGMAGTRNNSDRLNRRDRIELLELENRQLRDPVS